MEAIEEATGDATGAAPAFGLLPALPGTAGAAALDSSDPPAGDAEAAPHEPPIGALGLTWPPTMSDEPGFG